MTAERLFWQFRAGGDDNAVHLEHHGVSVDQAASYLIQQGALPNKPCSCCGSPVPLRGTQVRFVRCFGTWDGEGPDARWEHASMVADEWRTYPLSKKTTGGN